MIKKTTIKTIKSSVRRLLGNLCLASKLHRVRNQGKVLILAYHRVLPREIARRCWVQPGMYVTPEAFERQIRFLKRHFEILSLPDLLAAWAAGSLAARGRYCAITFDDGWLDNHTHAFPVLKAQDVPATVFLATSFVGTGRCFFPERLSSFLRRTGPAGWEALTCRCPALQGIPSPSPCSPSEAEGAEAMDAVIENLKQQGGERFQAHLASLEEDLGVKGDGRRVCLDWSEVQEMSGEGISFGSHSSTHRLMSRLSLDQVREELLLSGRTLAREGVRYVPIFCYPNGDYTPEVKEAVRSCGYRAALTTRFGSEDCRGPGDPFEIKRVAVHQDISSDEALFSFHLSSLPRATGG